MMETDEYFSMRAAAAPGEAGRYIDAAAMGYVEVAPGLGIRPVVGTRLMVNFVSFAPHTEAPMHLHEEEQIAIVIEGDLEVDLDGDVRTLHDGELAIIPAWVPHAMRTHENACREMDIFSPPRRALLQRLEAATAGTPSPAGDERGVGHGAEETPSEALP
jgi:quercetin dioxygenase-like cupin family protein